MLVIPSTIGPPATISVTFNSVTFGADLTTVTSVVLNVLRRDGTVGQWNMQIVSATPSSLLAQYAFTGGEITSTGLYYLNPVLDVPGGAIPAETLTALVSNTTPPNVEESVNIAASSVVASLGPVKSTWVGVSNTNSPFAASGASPWMAVDLSGGVVSITLPAANDGDLAVMTDYKNAAGSHSLTVIAAAGDSVPQGNGSFAGSVVLSSPGFMARWKYSKSLSQWLPW